MMMTQENNRHLKPVLWLFIAFQLLLFAPRLNSDGAYYYEYLRSWVIQDDMNFDDEREFYTWEWVPVFRDFLPGDWDETGYPPNIFSFGPALCWLPFYLLAHLLIKIMNALQAGFSTTGYGLAYRFLPMAVSMLSGLVTIHLCDRLGKLTGFKESVRTNALFFFIGASHLPAFLFVTPAFSHAVSVMFTCWFISLWYSESQDNGPQWNLFHYGLYGFVGGLAVIARWQNLFCVILPAVDGLLGLLGCRSRRSLGQLCLKWTVFWLGLICAIFPQLLVTRTLYGCWVTDPQGDGGMHWLSPSFRIVLFDGIKGLFTVNPILLPALLALPFLWKRNRRLTWGLTLLVISQSYINAVRRDWAGVGFGMRRFLNLTPAFVLGLMVIFALVQSKKHLPMRRLLQSAGTLLIIWNLLLMAQYYLSPLGAPWIEMTFTQMISAQFSQAPGLLKELVASSLLSTGLAGNWSQLALAVISLCCIFGTFKLLPPIARKTQGVFCLRPDKLLSGVLIFWVVVTGWLTHTVLQAKPYTVINLLPGEKRFGTIRSLKLNPDSGYYGYAGGVMFGPGSMVRILDPRAEYERNKFLAPGELRISPTLPVKNDGTIAWNFPEPIPAQRLSMITSRFSSDLLPADGVAAELLLITETNDVIPLELKATDRLVNTDWPALKTHESAGDARYLFDLNGMQSVTSMMIRNRFTTDEWTIRGIAFE